MDKLGYGRHPLADVSITDESYEFNYPFLSYAENKVLTYRYAHNYPYNKIAQMMRRSKNAVKQLAYRARRKVRYHFS